MKKRVKITIVTGGIIVLLSAVGVIVFLRSQSSTTSQTTGANTTQRPSFQTLTPHNTSDTKLENATVRSTPNDGQVFTYTDTIDGVAIAVNQQQLPKNTTPGDIAKNLNATNKLSGNGVTVYVGTSEQGAQTAVFSAKNLLILIKSASTIKDTSWTRYAASLN